MHPDAHGRAFMCIFLNIVRALEILSVLNSESTQLYKFITGSAKAPRRGARRDFHLLDAERRRGTRGSKNCQDAQIDTCRTALDKTESFAAPAQIGETDQL